MRSKVARLELENTDLKRWFRLVESLREDLIKKVEELTYGERGGSYINSFRSSGYSFSAPCATIFPSSER